MKQSLVKLSKSEILFLKALLADGHKTDAQIARDTGLSKPSANRIRKKLEGEKVLDDYIPIIDLEQFGIQLYAVILFEWTAFTDNDATKKMEKEFASTPQVVYFAAGESSNNVHYCSMLGFFDIEDYHAFFSEFRRKYGKSLGHLESFIIPGSKVLKQDFTDLAKLAIERGVSE